MRVQAARISGPVMDLTTAMLLMIAAAGAAELLHALTGLTRLSLLFLAAVTIAASVRGGRAGLFAAVLGVLFYKMFLDLRTGDQTGLSEDILNLLIFLNVALLTGTLAGRLHDEADRSRRHAERMTLLLRASRNLSDDDEEAFGNILAETLADACGARGLIFDSSCRLRAPSGELAPEESVRQLVAKLLHADNESIVRCEGWSARLLRADGAAAGVMAWELGEPDSEIDGVVEILAELASASISRMRARQEQVRVRGDKEATRLRETILSSISHDFRSPLSAIIGSATSLLDYGDKFEASVHRDLLLNIRDEGERLNEFIASLLNMSRLQAGVMEPTREPVSIDHVVRAAINRLKRHKGHALKMQIKGSCEATADALLLEQAVYNILDNAVKYASATGHVQIHCKSAHDGCEIVVADQGPGLSRDDQVSVFSKFRGSDASDRPDSTGLGLYIAKGFVEAIGGSIHARDRVDGERGLEMVIKLPCDR